MIEDLKTKTVYVIGGCGLIGTDLVKRLKKRCRKIIVIDEITKPSSKKLIYTKFNIHNLNDLQKRFDKFFLKNGKPNIMVNCSYPKTGNWNNLSFDNFDLKTTNENLDVHIKSFLNYTYFFANHMRKKKIKGSIVNLSSIYGLKGQKTEIYKNRKINPIYPLIKSSIIGSTKQFASFYGKYQIRVNTICPGGILSNNKNKMSNQFLKEYLKLNPIKRMCKPEDVSNAIIFLSSNASNYITGTSLIVDGGWTAV